MIPLDTPVQHDRFPYDRGAWRKTVRYINNQARQMDHVRWAIREDPENLWAMMMLAGRAETPAERRALRRELIRIGMRHWAHELSGDIRKWNLADDPDFYPVMVAIAGHAEDLWEEELDAEAFECFRLLRKLDPQDKFHIIGMMARCGYPTDEPDAASGRKQRAGTQNTAQSPTKSYP